VLRQCIELIARTPSIITAAYQVRRRAYERKSMYFHSPKPEFSTAQNILRTLRSDKTFTEEEAHLLDLCLMLHAEHGGGNNSTFTTRVLTSSGTDTYSAIAAAVGSLKGPKHGGANIKVVKMFHEMQKCLKDWEDEEEVKEYLRKLLHKEAFDKSGLIYGMGHAIYSVSDPRAEVLKSFVEALAHEKGRLKDYRLYALVERLAPEVIAEERKIYKGVSANVDFYSGFVYSMLDLPLELYTPMFAVARIVGWSAHRMEELINTDKIIRPAYMNVLAPADYVPLAKR
jgi:citrate synthase